MSLDDTRTAALVAAVRRVAAEEIGPRFRGLDGDQIRQKSHAYDLVTEADTRAEARLTEMVNHLMPEALIVGEEAVSEDASLVDRLAEADLAVVIDPVDGTWNFANGLAVFGTILAVTQAGHPVWGMIHDTISDSWIETRQGRGTQLVTADGRRDPLRFAAEDRDLADLCGYSHSFLFPMPARRKLFERLPELRRVMSLRCSAWEYRMIAEGRGEDFCLSPVLNPWDHLAGCLAVREAGGVARIIGGEDYHGGTREGRLLVARSEAMWHKLAEHFADI